MNQLHSLAFQLNAVLKDFRNTSRLPESMYYVIFEPVDGRFIVYPEDKITQSIKKDSQYLAKVRIKKHFDDRKISALSNSIIEDLFNYA